MQADGMSRHTPASTAKDLRCIMPDCVVPACSSLPRRALA